MLFAALCSLILACSKFERASAHRFVKRENVSLEEVGIKFLAPPTFSDKTLDMKWQIHGRQGENLIVYIFDVNDWSLAEFNLRVTDGIDENGTALLDSKMDKNNSVYGKTLLRLHTNYNSAIIHFTAQDSASNHIGFRAVVSRAHTEILCGDAVRFLDAEEIELTLPENTDEQCIWFLFGDNRYNAKLSFRDFQTPLIPQRDGELTIYSGFGIDSQRKLARFSGSGLDRKYDVTANENRLTVRNRGPLFAIYSTIPVTTEHLHRAARGMFMSNRYPYLSEEQHSATWQIRVHSGFAIRVDFIDFKTFDDSVTVYDGMDASKQREIKFLSGISSGTVVTSCSSDITVVYSVGRSYVKRVGFRAVWHEVSEGHCAPDIPVQTPRRHTKDNSSALLLAASLFGVMCVIVIVSVCFLSRDIRGNATSADTQRNGSEVNQRHVGTLTTTSRTMPPPFTTDNNITEDIVMELTRLLPPPPTYEAALHCPTFKRSDLILSAEQSTPTTTQSEEENARLSPSS